STTPPASAAPRRRTMISTSGSSGTARRRYLRGGGGRLPAPEAAAERAQWRHIDGDAVAVGDGKRRERRHTLAGDDDADEVERIGGRQDDRPGVLPRAPDRPEGFDRLGQGELLADEPVDEAPAADLAAGLEAPEDRQEHPPRRGVALPNEEVAEDDAVAAEELPGHELVAFGRILLDRVSPPERPAAGRQGPAPTGDAGDATGATEAAARHRPEAGVAGRGLVAAQQQSKPGDAVATHQAGGHQVPERVLDLGRQPAGPASDLRQEGGTTTGEELRHFPGSGRQAGQQAVLGGGDQEHGQVLPKDEGEGTVAHRPRPTGAGPGQVIVKLLI